MKQVILVRTDLSLSSGKAVAQGSHVSVRSSLNANETERSKWLDEGGKKITLAVASEQELRNLIDQSNTLPTAVVSDHGHTEVDQGTTTAGAIGPADDDKIDEITGHLDLYTT